MNKVSGLENSTPRGDSLSTMPEELLRAMVIGLAKAFDMPLTVVNPVLNPLAIPIGVLPPETDRSAMTTIYDPRAMIAQQIPRRTTGTI